MSVHIRYEAAFLLYSFAAGGGLMMAYDFLRAFRIFIPHRPLCTGIEDFFYWIYAAAVTFSLLYDLNDGGLRGYAILSVIAGMVVYDRLVSLNFLKLLKKGWKYLRMKMSKHFRPKKAP